MVARAAQSDLSGGLPARVFCSGLTQCIIPDHPMAGGVGRGTFGLLTSDVPAVLTAALNKRFGYCGLPVQATCLDLGMWAGSRFRKVAVSNRTGWRKVKGPNERAVSSKVLRSPATLI